MAFCALHAVVLGEGNGGDGREPIFVLAGGPGQAATTLTQAASGIFRSVGGHARCRADRGESKFPQLEPDRAPAAATEQTPNRRLMLASFACHTRSSLAADTCQVSSSGRVYQVCISSTS